MEDLLEQIIKEATGNKFLHLRNAAQTAHGKITPTTYIILLTIMYFTLFNRQTAAPAWFAA